MNLKPDKFSFLIIFLLISVVSWQLLIPGYFSVHDDMHLAWVYEMSYALKHFQFPPRFAAHLSWGFGYPLFTFIYPLPYYIGSLFNLLGLNLVDSIKLLHFLAFVLSAIFMWLYARKWGTISGLIVTALYTLAPYRAVVTYVRGALGEAWVFVFIPLILWRIDQFSQKPNLKNISLLALVTGLFLLTHNIAVLMFLPFLVGYALFQFIKFRTPISKISLTGGLAALTVSYFWIPALVYKSQMTDDPIYAVVDHFPFIKQLILPSWGYGASLWGPGDGLSFQIGIGLLVVIGLALFVLLKKLIKEPQIDKKLALLTLSILVVLFLMNVRSLFIWQTIPYLNYFQFPWRWLMTLVVVIPIMAGYISKKYKSKQVTIILFICVFISFGFSLFYFQPHDRRMISDQDIRTRFFPIDPENPQSQISLEYTTLTEEYLRLPQDTTRPKQLYPEMQITLADQFISQDYSNPYNLQAQIHKLSDQPVVVRRYNLPGWHVLANSHKPVTMTIPPHNSLGIVLPSGDYSLQVFYQDPIWVSILNWSSAITFLLLISTILWQLRKNK